MAASWGAANLYPTGGTYLMDTSIAEANDAALEKLNAAVKAACDAFHQETGLYVDGVGVWHRSGVDGPEHVALASIVYGWKKEAEYVELKNTKGEVERVRI